MIQKKKFSDAIAADITVLEELIKPLKISNEITAFENTVNELTKDGIYSLGASPTCDMKGPDDHGFLIVQHNKNILFQWMFSVRGTIFSRFKTRNGKWENWKKICPASL